MEDSQLQQMWAEYDRKLEEAKILNLQSWALNLRSLEAMQMQKAKSKLNRLATFKIWVIILGIVWVLFLCTLVFSKITWQGIFFNISFGCIAFINVIAIVVYIKQVVLIRQIDNSESVVETQQKLAKLQASTLRIGSILWLQTPFWGTFFLSPAMLQSASAFWLSFTIIITGLLTFAAIWLFRNIHYRNRHKKWFTWLFNTFEWTAVTKAMAFLDEVEEFKKSS
jgi:hypothetical protein